MSADRASGTADPGVVAARLTKLYETIQASSDSKRDEIVSNRIFEKTGTSFSTQYLWELRTGRKRNPTKDIIDTLANVFEVRPSFFLDPDPDPSEKARVDLAASLTRKGVLYLSTRLAESDLTPETIDLLTKFIDSIVPASPESSLEADGI